MTVAGDLTEAAAWRVLDQIMDKAQQEGSSWICMKTTLEKTGFSDGQRSVEASV